MSTYQDMIDRIEDEIDDDNLTAQVQLAIVSAIKHHERTRFYFNQKVATFNTVASQEYYDDSDQADIPNLIAIDAMTVALNSQDMPVLPTDFGWIDAQQNGSLVGNPPGNYAYYAQQIRFFGIPDAVYPISMAIHYKLTALSAGTDTNAWTNDAEELIRQRAKIILHSDVIQGQGSERAIGFARGLETEARAALIKETRKKMADMPLYTEICAIVQNRGRFNINRGW